jgi:hypothetical protein
MHRRRLILAFWMSALGVTASLGAQGHRSGRDASGAPDHREPPLRSQNGDPATLTGVVSGKGAHGDTIRLANVLVQLWSTDEQTEAARHAACGAWLSDKGVWLQAKQELEYPSDLALAGTPVGHDVDILRALLALRRDTVRTGANGGFTFQKVPFGAYTVEAEAVANDKFVQWTKDVGVIPAMPAQVDLGAESLVENQYCELSAAPVVAEQIYEAGSLDRPLVVASHRSVNISETPSLRSSSTPMRISFVVGHDGIPDPTSVHVTQGSLPDDEARKLVEAITYQPPTVQDKAVKVRTELEIRMEVRASPGH